MLMKRHTHFRLDWGSVCIRFSRHKKILYFLNSSICLMLHGRANDSTFVRLVGCLSVFWTDSLCDWQEIQTYLGKCNLQSNYKRIIYDIFKRKYSIYINRMHQSKSVYFEMFSFFFNKILWHAKINTDSFILKNKKNLKN